jgi:intracellular sulfur oxidation DsrE/DsrF family protein
MKNWIIVLSTILSLLLSGTHQLNASNKIHEKDNYLIFSKDIRQIGPILTTAKELMNEDDEKFGEFHVVFCGKTVRDIPNNNGFKKFLEEAEKLKVQVFACGISLNKFNVDRKLLPGNIKITENGILYGLQLAKEGFITLSI